MKKGKSCVLKGFKNLKCSYGTVDAKNFKSLYLNIQTWAEPKIYLDDWTRQVSYFLRQIKMFESSLEKEILNYPDDFTGDFNI
jgi:hypothetical protein